MIQETIDLKASGLEEDRMISQERWDEIRRLRKAGETVSAIARRFDLDRKTVRGWLRKDTWTPYRRVLQGEHLLETHAEFLREQAAAVDYSAQILYQELRQQRDYSGSYATFVTGGVAYRFAPRYPIVDCGGGPIARQSLPRAQGPTA
jgi:transposase-like protein